MEQNMNNSFRSTTAFILTALCIVMWPDLVVGAESDASVISQNEIYGGLTYQEWHALYVDQKIVSLYGYPPSNPDFNSPVVHLLTFMKNGATELSDTVAVGKTVMLMLICMLDNEDPVVDDSGGEVSFVDQDFEDWIWFAARGSFSCTIDGVPVRNLQNYVIKNKLPQNIAVTGNDGNIGHWKARYNWSIGVDLLLDNLSVGIHVIRIHNSIPEYNHYTSDFTYLVEVKPDVTGQQ
jgi:hypothetical protein